MSGSARGAVAVGIAIAIASCRNATATITPMDPPAAAGALAPYLHATSDGVLATWLEAMDAGHRLRVARWNGRTWSVPTTIVEGPQIVANWADVPSIAAGKDGALVAHWGETPGDEPDAYDAVVARSPDGGRTWQRLGPLHRDGTRTEHGFVSLVAEAAGVQAFWLDGRAMASGGGATALYTATVGTAIGDERLVDDRVCDCCNTAAVDAPGGPVVAYRDRTADEIRDIAVASSTGASRIVHADSWRIAGCPVNGPAIASRDGLVALAWFTGAAGDARVEVSISTDAGVVFGPPVEVDGSRDDRAPIGRVAVVVDGDDAIVAWVASRREDARVLVRRVSARGLVGAELAVATTVAGRDAGFPRIARSGDQLIVAWTDPAPPSRVRAVSVPLAAIPRPTEPSRPAAHAPSRIARVGDPAPALSAIALDGTPVALAARPDRVVVLNVWATWCEPCRQELPRLAALKRRVASRGVDVIAVSVDRARTREQIAGFAKRFDLPFAIWHDPDDRISSQLDARTLPVTLVIGRDGTIRWRHDGVVVAEDSGIEDAIEAELAR